MKRVIYSLYIDVPKEELDVFDKNILKPNVVLQTIRQNQNLKKTMMTWWHANKLMLCL